MKAARWHAAKDIRVEDIDEPQVAAGDIKIKRIEIDDIVTEGFEALSSEKSQVKILVKAPA